jgi:hypothetical protein
LPKRSLRAAGKRPLLTALVKSRSTRFRLLPDGLV